MIVWTWTAVCVSDDVTYRSLSSGRAPNPSHWCEYREIEYLTLPQETV